MKIKRAFALLITASAAQVALATTGGGRIKPPAGITDTIGNISAGMSGPIGTSLFVVAIIIAGAMWWLNRSGKAGETLGKVVVGAVIIFGATQITKWVGDTAGATAFYTHEATAVAPIVLPDGAEAWQEFIANEPPRPIADS